MATPPLDGLSVSRLATSILEFLVSEDAPAEVKVAACRAAATALDEQILQQARAAMIHVGLTRR